MLCVIYWATRDVYSETISLGNLVTTWEWINFWNHNDFYDIHIISLKAEKKRYIFHEVLREMVLKNKSSDLFCQKWFLCLASLEFQLIGRNFYENVSHAAHRFETVASHPIFLFKHTTQQKTHIKKYSVWEK